MRTTKIQIKNLFGIAEKELDGSSIEITGTNGAGKTSVIDAIRYALTNDSNRDYVIRQGATEGEILVETDTGLSINRKKRSNQADYKSVKDNGKTVQAPENFLSQIFTPLQLDPVAFTQMPRQEQNRVILDLIEFPWDLEWIREKFGEIPSGINYQQNILQVLNDIQAENGDYFRRRQDLNRDVRNKRVFIEDIARDIPSGYSAETWDSYSLADKYQELEKIRTENDKITRAKAFKESRDNKVRGLQAEKEIAISSEEKAVAVEREGLLSSIERMKAEMIAAEEKIAGLSGRVDAAKELAEARYSEGIAKLDKDMGLADEYSQREVADTAVLMSEISNAEAMKKHLNEYRRMQGMQRELDSLVAESEDLTEKIELARELPSEILKTATIPVAGLAVENGVPLINGLPVSNLSEGEQLDLCVDVAISKPNALQIILIDGAEKLSDDNRDRLYKKCKDKGLQFIAARTTNDNELVVTKL